jgi:hypothetical protein
MKRITEVELYGTLDVLNTLLGEPLNAAEIGSYHFSRAYGGWQLHRTMNASGGIQQITDGYVSKRLMCERMWSMIAGIRMESTAANYRVDKDKITT